MSQKNNLDNEKLTKNKSRVNDFGEVFTPNKIVNDMVSLIDDNIDVLNSKYLEPACGEGSFIQKILKDKISLVKKKYKKDTKQLLINSLYIYTTLYGIDILQDNVLITKRILKEIYEENFSNYIEKYPEYELIKNLKFILNTNIICGDALTLLKNNNEPIIFSEWSLIEIK